MALVINTNLASIMVQHNLNAATTALNKSLERMTTGYKINHANDNAAGFSIMNSWTTKIGSLDIAADNASMGNDLLSTSEENYTLLTTHLQRIRDLTEQASNGTYGSVSLKAMRSEVQARLEEISRVAVNAEFNDIKLMSKGAPSTNGLSLQIGLDATNDSVIKLSSDLFNDATVSGLFHDNTAFMAIAKKANNNQDISEINSEDGYKALSAAFTGLKISGNDFVKQTDPTAKPSATLSAIDAALSEISSRATQLGAAQSRVDSAISAIDVRSTNLTSSLSTLRDTDVAEESSKYIQAQILQQASATLLATANQAPSVALNLL